MSCDAQVVCHLPSNGLIECICLGHAPPRSSAPRAVGGGGGGCVAEEPVAAAVAVTPAAFTTSVRLDRGAMMALAPEAGL